MVKSVHILGEYVTELVLDSYNTAHDGEIWGIISLLFNDIITDVQGLWDLAKYYELSFCTEYS